MAIYRCEAKVISRAGGRSSVASASYRTGRCATSAAAYRAAAKLTDERTGQHYDFTRKGGVAGAEIMVPEGAPAWMCDRSKLWNGVEHFERRKDAQLARDFIISLPHELTEQQRMELTREFVREQFTARGYVADVAWHSPDAADSLNHHAHVMVTMRKVEGNSFAARKERPPEGEHPAKAWKDELARLREAWARTANTHLEKAGLDIRIDHRSLVDRGIDREPEPKQGSLALQIERDGRASFAGNERRAAKARNFERMARGGISEMSAGQGTTILDEKPAAQKEPTPQARPAEPSVTGAARQEVREQIAGLATDAQKLKTPPVEAVKDGLKVADRASGALMPVADFVTNILAGAAPEPKAARFTLDPEERKRQQIAMVAAKRQAQDADKALERIDEDIKAGRNLKPEDIQSLTRQQQEQIRHFGDTAVRDMVDAARKRAEEYWKGSGRERER